LKGSVHKDCNYAIALVFAMHIFLCGFKSQFYLSSVHIFAETRARPTTQEEVANCGCILLWRKRSWWNQTHGGKRYILTYNDVQPPDDRKCFDVITAVFKHFSVYHHVSLSLFLWV